MALDKHTIITLESLLRQEMGLNISSLGKNAIKKALNRRMKALPLDTHYSYLSLIKRSSKELNAFIDEIAINETWFYRDEEPFKALGNYAITWFEDNPDSHFRLLSIPCSTGEEAYSMSIALAEIGLSTDKFTIDAIDISTRSLEAARNGIFKKNSFRGQSTRFQNKYFDKIQQSSFQIKPELQTNINFLKGNLLNLSLPLAIESYDVIFSRNLLIYLDYGIHKKVIATLAGLLKESGLLFIGHSESGLFVDTPFIPAPYPKSFSFVKKQLPKRQPTEASETTEADTEDSTKSCQTRTIDQPPELTEQNEQSTIFDEERIDIQHAQELLSNGDHKSAISIYEKIIQQSGPSANIFYLLATIFFDISEFENSIKMLKKAVYLEPNFIEAINLLSRIYKETGDEKNFLASTRRSKRVQQRLAHES